jgi:hypothetical protein
VKDQIAFKLYGIPYIIYIMASELFNIFVKCMDGTMLSLEVTQGADIPSLLVKSYPDIFPPGGRVRVVNHPGELHADDMLYVLYEDYYFGDHCKECSGWIKKSETKMVNGARLIDTIDGDRIVHSSLARDANHNYIDLDCPIEEIVSLLRERIEEEWKVIRSRVDDQYFTRADNMCFIVLGTMWSETRLYYLCLHNNREQESEPIIMSTSLCIRPNPSKPSIFYNARMNSSKLPRVPPPRAQW